jgi:hypothetical protein
MIAVSNPNTPKQCESHTTLYCQEGSCSLTGCQHFVADPSRFAATLHAEPSALHITPTAQHTSSQKVCNPYTHASIDRTPHMEPPALHIAQATQHIVRRGLPPTHTPRRHKKGSRTLTCYRMQQQQQQQQQQPSLNTATRLQPHPSTPNWQTVPHGTYS